MQGRSVFLYAQESRTLRQVATQHLQQFKGGSKISCMQAGDERVAEDMRRVGRYGEGEAPRSAQALAGRLLATVYMGTANSSGATRARASALASQVGPRHSPAWPGSRELLPLWRGLIAWLAACWPFIVATAQYNERAKI